MLLCYILSKHRFLRLKICRNKEIGVFKKGGYEYNIDRKKIYTKKILGFKTVFWCMYLEGNPNPIEFDESGVQTVVSDVPLDELAILMHKVIHGVIEIAIILLVVFNLLLTVGVIWKVYNLG